MNNAQKRELTSHYVDDDSHWEAVSGMYYRTDVVSVVQNQQSQLIAHRLLISPIRARMANLQTDIRDDIAYHSIFFDRTRLAQRVISHVRRSLS